MSTAFLSQLQAALGDTLVIQRELGGGGMSRVFLAHDPSLQRDVVVKVLSAELAAGLSADRFTREIRLAASLQEPHIVPLLTAGTTSDGLPWFTMPFVSGETLRTRLAEGALPTTEAIGILRNIAQALAYAHTRGVIHRDIKPENVLLSSGTAVVADFGIAKALGASRTQSPDVANTALTQAGMAIGTPAYMAPEQAIGDVHTDHRADIYSWGVLAYELLEGTHPFADRATAAAMTAAHIATPAPYITRSDASPALRALVARCLAKDPVDRPPTMDAVLGTLSRGSESVVAPSATSNGGSGRRIAIVASMAIALALGAWWASSRSVAAEVTVDSPRSAFNESSLAVIPFTSAGGDTANTYLAEGIADELTTVLVRVPGLRLAGRSSAARFKSSALSSGAIADTLGVRTVLLGTLRRAGNRVRVTAELSQAGDGRVLWQDTFEQDARDVFKMQELLATAIAAQLQLRLSATSLGVGTSNSEAYDQYLRGMQVYRNRGPVYTDAERYFDAAIRLDSSFARAWAGKAIALMGTPYYAARHVSDLLPVAKAAASQALRLDSLNPEVHIALSSIALESFEWEVAEREVRRAIALDSLNATAHWRLGFTFINQGRVAESLAAFSRACELDPLAPTSVFYRGTALVLMGRTDEGVAEAIRGYEINPSLVSGQALLLTALMSAGREVDAARYALRFVSTMKDPMRLGTLAQALIRGGRLTEGRLVAQQLERLPNDLRGVWYSRLGSRSALGDVNGAIAAMESAAAGDGDLVPGLILSAPMYDSLRASLRFRAALVRYHLENSPLAQRDGGRVRLP